MKIMVSACLLGENCKYNGGNNRNEKILNFLEGHEVIPVCPEVMGGLSVPRPPCEIRNGVVMNDLGENVDRQFREGAEKGVQLALKEKVELVILQPRSPSCGCRMIYDGTFTGRKIPGMGVFASMLQEAGIPMMDGEEIE